MRQLRVHLSAAVGAAAIAAAMLSAGTADADDYAGQTYGDVSGAISDAGRKAVIATRSGDAPTTDTCLVTHSQPAPWLKGLHFDPVTDTVLLDLDCGAPVATAKKAGSSAASRQGWAALAEAAKEAPKKK